MTTKQRRIAKELQEASKCHGRNNRYLNNPVMKAALIETIAQLQSERETDPHRVYNWSPKKVVDKL
jgi:hypothetical protein